VISTSSETGGCTAALQQGDVAPSAIHAADSFARPDDAKAVAFMDRDTGDILRKDCRLQSPYSVLFGRSDQRGEKLRTDTFSASALRDVNTDLGDAPVNFACRDRTQRGPTGDFRTGANDQTALSEMRTVPLLPVGNFGFEGRIAGANSFLVNGANCVPIPWQHRPDGDRSEHAELYAASRQNLLNGSRGRLPHVVVRRLLGVVAVAGLDRVIFLRGGQMDTMIVAARSGGAIGRVANAVLVAQFL
jgi:hypothetical protein